MATVDFLPFAIGGGANVLDQADYAALGAVSTGYVAGTAISQELNKTWRQSSFQAAVVANFVSQALNADVLDDGDLSTAISQFFAAIRATIPAGPKWSGVSGGSANAQTLTPTIAATSYVLGDAYSFEAGATNSGATTVNISGLGTKNVFLPGPAGIGPRALTGNEIVGGNIYVIQYDGSQFQLSHPAYGTMSLQSASGVAISGGTINGTPIGGSATAAGAFTTLSASGQITSTVSGGTAPLIVASSTVVANLNASLLLGQTWANPGAIGGGTPATTITASGLVTGGNFTTAGGYTSTIATGTAPLSVASTTVVPNLNVEFLQGNHASAFFLASSAGALATLGVGTGLTSGGGNLNANVVTVAGRTGNVVIANTDVSGLGTMSTQNANGVAVVGGTVSGVDITASTLNSTVVGGSVQAAGHFTTLQITGNVSGPLVSNSIGAVLVGGTLWAEDQKSSGTGAGTLSAGSFATRTLNTAVVNSITGSTLGSNQITLPIGIYRIWASAPAVNANHQIRWRNITDGATTIVGTSEVSPVSNVTRSMIVGGEFTITGSAKTFELQHFANISATAGLAVTSGEVEVYATVFIEQVGL